MEDCLKIYLILFLAYWAVYFVCAYFYKKRTGRSLNNWLNDTVFEFFYKLDREVRGKIVEHFEADGKLYVVRRKGDILRYYIDGRLIKEERGGNE